MNNLGLLVESYLRGLEGCVRLSVMCLAFMHLRSSYKQPYQVML